MIINPTKQLNGEITVPGDKSISHRAIIFASLSKGTTEIKGFLLGEDCLSTIRCFKQLGVDINTKNDKVTVTSNGLYSFKEPKDTLHVGNSGTTLRLISGILAAQPFTSTLTGDDSIQKRPMLRIVNPLRMMGAKIEGKDNGNLCPLTIYGQKLTGFTYKMPVASAQVKSCILLASLYANSPTTIIEPAKSRNHTEIMMEYFGNNLKIDGLKIISYPNPNFICKKIIVPGDISSAAYFIVAGLILKNSKIKIKNVGINDTRTGLITILRNMGADITYENIRTLSGEKTADIIVKSSNLKGTTVSGDIIPKLIDEIPIIAVAACYAKGTTVIKDALELKVKESNRIKTMVCELKKMSAHIEETKDGMIIQGGSPLHSSSKIESYNDHRVAMSMTIAALGADGISNINNVKCIDISYPNFFKHLNDLNF